MAILTHGVKKLLYELNFRKFWNVFFNIVDKQSLRCYNNCNIQNVQVWETIAVLIYFFSITCGFFWGKYDDPRLQNKERPIVLFAII